MVSISLHLSGIDVVLCVLIIVCGCILCTLFKH